MRMEMGTETVWMRGMEAELDRDRNSGAVGDGDMFTPLLQLSLTAPYLDLDLGPPVPSGTLGDELSPSGTVTGNTSSFIMSATATDTHLSHILCKCIPPCPLWPAPSSASSLWSPV